MLCDIFQGFAHTVDGTFALEDDGAARATAHVDIGLGALGNIAQDITEGLLELIAREHLRGSETELLRMFPGKTHDPRQIRRS